MASIKVESGVGSISIPTQVAEVNSIPSNETLKVGSNTTASPLSAVPNEEAKPNPVVAESKATPQATTEDDPVDAQVSPRAEMPAPVAKSVPSFSEPALLAEPTKPSSVRAAETMSAAPAQDRSNDFKQISGFFSGAWGAGSGYDNSTALAYQMVGGTAPNGAAASSAAAPATSGRAAGVGVKDISISEQGDISIALANGRTLTLGNDKSITIKDEAGKELLRIGGQGKKPQAAEAEAPSAPAPAPARAAAKPAGGADNSGAAEESDGIDDMVNRILKMIMGILKELQASAKGGAKGSATQAANGSNSTKQLQAVLKALVEVLKALDPNAIKKMDSADVLSGAGAKSLAGPNGPFADIKTYDAEAPDVAANAETETDEGEPLSAAAQANFENQQNLQKN